MMILFMNKSTVKKLINNIKRLMIEYNNKNQIADTELLISKLKNKIFNRIFYFLTIVSPVLMSTYVRVLLQTINPILPLTLNSLL